MKYQKPCKTYEAQVELWISRGLIVDNPEQAGQIFARLNYYRLSAYTLPFQQEKDHFNPGTHWDDILRLYEFDRELRVLVFSYLEPLEVAVRTAICHYLAKQYGPFGYTDAMNFTAEFQHNDWFTKYKGEQKRSRETFIRHYREKYTESPELPIWMSAEIMSFGAISRLFHGLRYFDQKNIGQVYNLPAPVFSSWLHFLTYIRNLCAHHSRLWNREMAIRPKFPHQSSDLKEIRNNRIVAFFAVAQYMFNQIHLQQNVLVSVQELFTKYPEVPSIPMGFQVGWEERSFWETG